MGGFYSMRLKTQLTTSLLCLFLVGCSTTSTSSVSQQDSTWTLTLDTKGVPESLSVLLNDEPQKEITNKGEIKLSVPEGQTNIIKVKYEEPFGTIIYGVDVPQEVEKPVPLNIEPLENEKLNEQVADFLSEYFTAVNQKKNALSYLSEDSILNPEDLYNQTYQSAVLYTASYSPFMINNKPGLIVRVDAEDEESPSSTRTLQFRLVWENEKWKIFHQRVLYEVSEEKLLFESEKGTYPGKQTPEPYDIVLF